MIIIAIINNNNIATKEFEKIDRYSELRVEIVRFVAHGDNCSYCDQCSQTASSPFLFLIIAVEFRSSGGETVSKTVQKLVSGCIVGGERIQYNPSAVSKRFLLAVSPIELLNSTDYEEKKRECWQSSVLMDQYQNCCKNI